MPRNATDLIKELTQEGHGAHAAVLLVGFEDSTQLVFNKEGALKELDALMTQGGEPIAICRVVLIGRQLQASVRPLAEYANEPWVKQYLTDWMKTLQREITWQSDTGSQGH